MAKSETVWTADGKLDVLPRPPGPPKKPRPFPPRPRIEWLPDDNQGDAPGKPHPRFIRILRLITGLSPEERQQLDLLLAPSRDESKSSYFSSPRTDSISKTSHGLADYADCTDGQKGKRDGVLTRDLDAKRQISAATADNYGLDQEEAHLALCYAAASKELAQRTLTATPEETTRLRGMKRLASLTLDLCQRLKVAVLLPPRLTDKRQVDLGNQLAATSVELRKLETTLFGEPRTSKNALVRNVEARTRYYHYTHQDPETPPPPGPLRAAESPPNSRPDLLLSNP